MKHNLRPRAGGFMAGILFLTLFVSGASGATENSAEEVVRTTTQQVLDVLRKEGDGIKGDSQRLYELIDDLILPHFDFIKMSSRVLGRYWRKASKQQQQAFIEQFQGLLVRTYAQALIDFRDQDIEVLPATTEASNPTVVRSRINQVAGPAIPINYRMQMQDNQWKVFDVSIDGVSIVTNYRASFSREIKRNGIDGLIKRLMNKNSNKT